MNRKGTNAPKRQLPNAAFSLFAVLLAFTVPTLSEANSRYLSVAAGLGSLHMATGSGAAQTLSPGNVGVGLSLSASFREQERFGYRVGADFVFNSGFSTGLYALGVWNTFPSQKHLLGLSFALGLGAAYSSLTSPNFCPEIAFENRMSVQLDDEPGDSRIFFSLKFLAPPGNGPMMFHVLLGWDFPWG